MTRLSKSYFMGWIFGSSAFGVVSTVLAVFLAEMARSFRGAEWIFILPLLLGLIAIVVGSVFNCILLHRLWTVIQGEDSRTTPGKAVGFCFIPFFSLYWIFQAYLGWAVDYNRHAKRIGLENSSANEGVALWFCILLVCGGIPCLGYFTIIGALVLSILFLNNAIDSANALIEFQGNSTHDDESA